MKVLYIVYAFWVGCVIITTSGAIMKSAFHL